MSRKKLLTITLCAGLLVMACNFGGLLTPKATETPTAAPATETDIPAPSTQDNMTSLLERLGGQTCEENPDFTCVTIQVPLNHFDSTNADTLDIVFAVAPATGERYGMYVQAFPGGPGGEGVSTGAAGGEEPGDDIPIRISDQIASSVLNIGRQSGKRRTGT